MLTVHHLNNSRSQRILWLLEELELEYELRGYQRDPDTNLAPASLEAVHPLGKSPVLTDGETTVIESGAIIDYILRHHGGGRLRPAADSAELEEYLVVADTATDPVNQRNLRVHVQDFQNQITELRDVEDPPVTLEPEPESSFTFQSNYPFRREQLLHRRLCFCGRTAKSGLEYFTCF